MSASMAFLLQAAVIIGLPYALWRLTGLRHWVPLAVMQIAVGLALGPSGLGTLMPALAAWLFPPASLGALGGLVWLAVSFFAFATGLHFDVTEFKGRGRAFAWAGLSTVAVPTLAGFGGGWLIWTVLPQAAGPGVNPWIFAAGIGIALGVTALPVLAAIVRDMGLLGTPLGGMALGLAAVNDAALWLMVAVLLALIPHGGALHGDAMSMGPGWVAASIAVLALAYGAVMLGLVRPALSRWLGQGAVTERHLVVLSVGIFLSALATEAMGVHAVVGAFVFGAIIPKTVAHHVLARLEPFLLVVLLPFFFMTTGLSTRLDAASGAWTVFVIATPIAVLTKMLSTPWPLMRGANWSWRPSLALGSLVACKGLMELVVLDLLRQRGILSDTGFSGMVLMALATTALATPLARLFMAQPGMRQG